MIKNYTKKTDRYFTKAIRFFKGKNIRFALSYSKSLNGRKWYDEDMTPVKVGYRKSQEYIFTARALILGRHKFSLLVAND